MKEAEKVARKTPKEVLTDSNRSYDDGIELAFGSDTEHVHGHPFKLKVTSESTSEIERFHGTLKDRTKVIRSFKDVETLIQFTNGWLIYYNFFKPHSSLEGKTPAEAAGLKYDVKNWTDLAKLPVSKQNGTSKPITGTPKTKISLETAFRRHRTPRITQLTPRITPSAGRLPR
jgi:hypothetical protein